MKRYILSLLICLLTLFTVNAQNGPTFRRISTKDGLSNSQVNCIYKDSRGFVWFGTESGLNRYDGFRSKVFFHENGNARSLPNNVVDDIQEDADGNLWILTAMGYCIYHAETESFDANPDKWMQQHGMSGKPDRIAVDRNRNMWIVVNGKGVYFFNAKTGSHHLFAQGRSRKNSLPGGKVVFLDTYSTDVVITFDNGTIAVVSGKSLKLLNVDRYVAKINHGKAVDYSTRVDRQGNYWMSYNGKTRVWSRALNRWLDSAAAMLALQGYRGVPTDMIAEDIAEDGRGHLWIATEHMGLYMLDANTRTVTQYTYNSLDSGSLPNNTLQCLYVDNLGALWIGAYKNGVAYYSTDFNKFKTIYIGDVCTITEDAAGNLWCGTNDAGIVAYNPGTTTTRQFRKDETGLGSDVVVSSIRGNDGSLWFGSFNGGLTHYKDGKFKAYRADGRANSLASDNVWALMCDASGNIIIGTLGGGLQILNPITGRFYTYNMNNSGITSDYISSLSFDTDGNIIAGQSQDFSVVNALTHKVTNYKSTKSGDKFSNSAINQTICDSRGLIWNATASGLTMYDPKTDKMETVRLGQQVNVITVCAIVEDREHTLWVTTDNGVSNVKVEKNEDGWTTFVTNYNDMDGLQQGLFNGRSVLLADNGNIVVGGQGGINIIPRLIHRGNAYQARPLFSGLILFDHPLSIGEEYNGNVVLKRALTDGSTLKLKHSENAFTLLLASDIVSLPDRTRFKYRLRGFSDRWMITTEGQPQITFTNLSSGSYTLEVKVVNRDGSESDNVGSLDIVIAPPFYLSVWAILIYILIIAGALYYAKKNIERRQKVKFEIKQVKMEAEQSRKLDDMKLKFFTNVSHELRTPLTLIISPLTNMIGKEEDADKKGKLELIHRNAVRLLNMVNQILDFRKMDRDTQSLSLLSGDIVEFVHTICNSFKELAQTHVSLTFYSAVSSLIMRFDDDKVRKIMNNLLSNAFKFTSDGGRVDVSLRLLARDEKKGRKEDMLEIKVADNGMGISDENKQHIFDRFYQTHPEKEQPYGGSGIGLSLVKNFAEMHDGTVTVEDNPGGGTVFMVYLPVRQDAGQPTVNISQLADIDNEKTCQLLTQENEIKVSQNGKETDMSSNEKKYEVLLVDDSEDFLSFMKDVMAQNYRVRCAVNGKDALKKIGEKQPDVILSDVMMPEMDGNELCRVLKANRDTKKIPFVMLTARLAQEQKIEGMEIGADDYVTKPFNLELLNLRIQNLIKWHNGQTQQLLKPEAKQVEITSVDEKMVKDATKYVEDNIDNSEISVETLSAELNMSRVQLYKKMVSVTGITPSEFMRSIRLQRAEQMLRQSQLSVSEVAYSVGFNNPRYFSKYFMETYGMTPSQYKHKNGDR